MNTIYEYIAKTSSLKEEKERGRKELSNLIDKYIPFMDLDIRKIRWYERLILGESSKEYNDEVSQVNGIIYPYVPLKTLSVAIKISAACAAIAFLGGVGMVLADNRPIGWVLSFSGGVSYAYLFASDLLIENSLKKQVAKKLGKNTRRDGTYLKTLDDKYHTLKKRTEEFQVKAGAWPIKTPNNLKNQILYRLLKPVTNKLEHNLETILRYNSLRGMI